PEPQSGHWSQRIHTTPKDQRSIYPGEGTILKKAMAKSDWWASRRTTSVMPSGRALSVMGVTLSF
ncbi:hypothetical protein, partial [Halomonas campaniensis]|uniref:hypothetical protein n=1 Tax=Halomonas campaniensis TaxID=213554 RepID=UPI003970C953